MLNANKLPLKAYHGNTLGRLRPDLYRLLHAANKQIGHSYISLSGERQLGFPTHVMEPHWMIEDDNFCSWVFIEEYNVNYIVVNHSIASSLHNRFIESIMNLDLDIAMISLDIIDTTNCNHCFSMKKGRNLRSLQVTWTLPAVTSSLAPIGSNWRVPICQHRACSIRQAYSDNIINNITFTIAVVWAKKAGGWPMEI